MDQTGRAVDIGQLWPVLLGSSEKQEANAPLLARDALQHCSAPISDLKVKRDAVNTDLIVGLDGAAYSYALEVGRGTIELNVGPYDTLFELETAFRAGLERLIRAAERLDWRVLGYGVQPLSPPGSELLSPKQRYGAMAEAMGEEWFWYTVTAGDQAHVDITRDEAVSVLNFGNLMAPVVVALCSNSPVAAGALTGDCSSREGRMIHAAHGDRHGMISRPYSNLIDFIERLSRLPSLLRREGERLLPDGRRFADVLRAEHLSCQQTENSPAAAGPDFDAFLLHDHYVWHSARLRAAYGTVELRPACQQPPNEAMAATALYLGLIEGHRQIAEFVQRALAPKRDRTPPSYWARMQSYHHQVIRAGLDAPEPAPGFLAQVLRLAAAALARRGYGEERMLTPLWRRLAQKENPAQQARRIFVEKGMEGLIESVWMKRGEREEK